MSEMKRRVALFKGDSNNSPVEQLAGWLDRCDADQHNSYDIGDPIPYMGYQLLVMYNVERIEPASDHDE